jgi:inner membrane protein
MLKEGHLGIGLLAYTPFGAAFLLTGHLNLFVVGGCAAIVGALVPDIDTSSPIFKHRGWTHTVWFVAVAMALGAIGTLCIGWYILTPERLPFGIELAIEVQEAAVVSGMLAVGIASHLFGDMITTRGIRPFDPVAPRGLVPITVSDRKFAFNLTKASSSIMNTAFLLCGVLGMVVVLVFTT